jgi:cytochrome c biogenesis protein CcdA
MKNKSFFKKTSAFALLALGLLTVSASASATGTFGDAAQQFQTQLGSFADVAMGVMFLAGLVIGGLAAFKFKAHSDNPGQNKITVPIIYSLVAALLIGLPAFLNMSKDTVLGSGAQGNSLNGSAYSTVGQ